MAKKSAGRPTVMTAKMQTEICKRLSSGESLNSICQEEKYPCKATVLLAVVQDRDGFSDKYMQAREAAGFAHADRVVDTVEKVAAGDLDDRAARAMLDGLKWAAERMAPRKHSQRQELSHTSPDGSMTPQPTVDASKLSDKALKELMDARKKSRNK